ncbi:MAG TPA: hypothetical protein VHN14_24680, partial [Kofleriaceae bacterium]|nr:hypothetical protein [Kofleriaceae bacterium]
MQRCFGERKTRQPNGSAVPPQLDPPLTGAYEPLPISMGTLGTLRGERQGETVQIDDRAGGSQKVHAEDATESEAVVHLADLQLEVIEAMAANRKPVDLANKTYSRPPTPRSILSRSPWLAKMPASPAMSAFSTELAAPVSTRTSGTVMIVPMCVTVAVTNTSSPRSVSCAEPTNTDPA